MRMEGWGGGKMEMHTSSENETLVWVGVEGDVYAWGGGRHIQRHIQVAVKSMRASCVPLMAHPVTEARSMEGACERSKKEYKHKI